MTDQNGNQSVLAAAQGLARARPRKPPSEMENKIFALLKSMPNRKSGITEAHCRAYANHLNAVAVLAHMNHQRPEAQSIGARRTQAELEKLCHHADKIAKAMNAAHQETNALIIAALPKDKNLSQYKHDMNEVFGVLYQADDHAGGLTAKGEKPSDKFAAEITRGAAQAFTALTVRKATVTVKQVPAGSNGTKAQSCGPFLDFLCSLFALLNIEASPEYHARQLRLNRS
jgi:hypothetical protein